MSTKSQEDRYTMPTYNRYPVILSRGQGATVQDDTGKTYIDFTSGIGVNSLGYCDAQWVDAVTEQAKTLQHTSNLYYTQPQADLAEKLCSITQYDTVFFANSGAEANECAIKLARKYSYDKYGEGRSVIVSLDNSFHGRTLATLTATGQPEFHQYFDPFPADFRYADPNSEADLAEKLDDKVCAVLLEYIQGEGGVCPLRRSYVDQLFALCADRDILVIADEVQTGVGRTGTFLAGEQYGHQADITTLAKGLGGGLPIGACLAKGKCAHTLTPGTHGSTFGGNPVSCAGALAVLNRVADPAFLAEVNRKSALFRGHLELTGGIEKIDGSGLMLGITLKEKNASDVVNAALKEGLLLLTAKEKVRLLPPLTISDLEIRQGTAILRRVLEA